MLSCTDPITRYSTCAPVYDQCTSADGINARSGSLPKENGPLRDKCK